MPTPEILKERVAEALVEASTVFREDQVLAYEQAINEEKNRSAKWVLELILENAAAAKELGKPLCDDTGIPHVYLEIGKEISITGRMLDSIQEGIALGLRKLPGRPMATRGTDLERLGQVLGLHEDPALLLPAPTQIRRIEQDKMLVTVLMLGGGPEIRARTFRVFHRREGMNVIDEVIDWACSEVSKIGCTPVIPAVGIGRTHYEATCLMLDAMRDVNFLEQDDIEKRITEAINLQGVGPLGLGGKITALASSVKIGEARAGGTRIACLRPGCCFDPRRATKEVPC